MSAISGSNGSASSIGLVMDPQGWGNVRCERPQSLGKADSGSVCFYRSGTVWVCAQELILSVTTVASPGNTIGVGAEIDWLKAQTGRRFPVPSIGRRRRSLDCPTRCSKFRPPCALLTNESARGNVFADGSQGSVGGPGGRSSHERVRVDCTVCSRYGP